MLLKRRIYLDSSAGATGNPSSPHEEGRRAKDMLESARLRIARLVECQADDVLFTSGATEGNALAILGYVRALRYRAGKDTVGRNNMHVLYLPTAHASIVENMKILAEEGVVVEPLPIRDMRVDSEALKGMIRKETVLVSMDAVCGETGVVWNTREVASVLKKEQPSERAMLHVDASQAPFTEKLTRAHFDADMLVLDGSKVGRARGIGVLVAHRTIPLVSLYGGGGQERGLRPGTESPELAKAFAQALIKTKEDQERFRLHAFAERARLVGVATSISDVVVNEGVAQAPNIVNISLLDRDTDYLVALLDEAGYAVSTKSACETDSEEGSRAVFALTGDEKRARSTLRISWGPQVTRRDLARFAAALTRAVAFIDTNQLS